jgi:hypothetical protein
MFRNSVQIFVLLSKIFWNGFPARSFKNPPILILNIVHANAFANTEAIAYTIESVLDETNLKVT